MANAHKVRAERNSGAERRGSSGKGRAQTRGHTTQLLIQNIWVVPVRCGSALCSRARPLLSASAVSSLRQTYLASMIAEQEAALQRFQNSAYLSETQNNTTMFGGGPAAGAGMAASMRAGTRGGGAGGGVGASGVHASVNLSQSASPYTFNRGAQSSNVRANFAAAPTPGYTRGGGNGRLSPTPSNSSAGSVVAPNTSVLANARRTLQHAAEWGATAGMDVGAGRNLSGSTQVSSPLSGPSATLNDTSMHAGGGKLSTAALTSELQGKMWSKEHSEWEKRMAELEGRLKRVNNASMAQSQNGAASQSQQQQLQLGGGQSLYNVPLVDGRPVQAGVNLANSMSPSGQKGHNVQTSELVLRLERELGAAVDALVQERKSTTTREMASQQRLEAMAGELEDRDRRLATLQAKWSQEFSAANAEFQEQLEKAEQKQRALQDQIHEKDREVEAKQAEIKKHAQRIQSVESEVRQRDGALTDCKTETERLHRRIKDLEGQLTNMENLQRSTIVDFEGKLRAGVVKADRSKEEWSARLEKTRQELQTSADAAIRQARQETQEAERKFREAENDNFVLANEVTRWKDTCAAREADLASARAMAAQDKANADSTVAALREQSDLASRLSKNQMQQSLDDLQNTLGELQAKYDAASRAARDAQQKCESLELDLARQKNAVAERDSQLASKSERISALQSSLNEAEIAATSGASLQAQLRASQASLLEEVQLLQKKLDARTTSKVEELKHLESEYKKFREKSRARTEDLEKSRDETRLKCSHLEKRNDALKADFETSLAGSTKEAQETIAKLERKIEKLVLKLSNTRENESAGAKDKERSLAGLRQELDRRVHAEELALRQLHDMESCFKAERSKCVEIEAKLHHILAVAPDGLAHQRLREELTAAKQVAANIQGRYKELQAKFERQSTRQTALQNLLARYQDERPTRSSPPAAAARSYLAQGNLPLYRPLENGPPPLTSTLGLGSGSGSGGSAHGGPLAPQGSFSREEEEMFRVLLRDTERGQRVRAHVAAYARGDLDTATAESATSSDEDHRPAAARGTYASRIRSRSAPRARARARGEGDEGFSPHAHAAGATDDSYLSASSPVSHYGHGYTGSTAALRASRAKDDADVNLNLKVNFDPRVLARLREMDMFPVGAVAPCAHAHLKPHDTRSCKICQRRAFGKGTNAPTHYAASLHIPSRASPQKQFQKQLPHA